MSRDPQGYDICPECGEPGFYHDSKIIKNKEKITIILYSR